MERRPTIPSLTGLRAPTPRPALLLAALLVLDLALLAFGAARSWDASPFLSRPLGDALEYWNWAGAIADGELIAPTPFLSAPLYPYVLGLLRALGAGLPAVFALQLLLRSATAVLLFRIGARASGSARLGLASAGLFLLLAEPAFFATRLVASALQLFLLACLLDAALRLGERRGAGRLIGCGALLGANVLANPPMLLFLLALPLMFGARERTGWRASVLVGAGALLAVSPATLHNALATRASPGGAELILVSAQSGVTYAHGNGPGALGVYRAIPGVSQDRTRQNFEAYALAARATGESGWRSADAYFRAQGVEWVLAHPGEAALLHLRKAGFLLFGQDYGDLYSIALENSDPSLPRPVPWPHGSLPTSWLLPAAFAGAFLIARRRARGAVPVIALLLIPCAVVLLFWYSPRYRLPVVVPACLLAPCAVRAALRTARPVSRAAALAAMVLVPAGGRALMLGAGLDDAQRFRPEYEFHVGVQFHAWDRPEAALPRLRRALELGHDPAACAERIGRAQLAIAERESEAGDAVAAESAWLAALAAFERALTQDPERLDSLVDAARTHLRLAKLPGHEAAIARARALLTRALSITVRHGDEERSALLRRMLAAAPPG